jgi:hypothetical protein
MKYKTRTVLASLKKRKRGRGIDACGQELSMRFVITVFDIFDNEQMGVFTCYCDEKDLVGEIIKEMHKVIKIYGKEFTFRLSSAKGEMGGLWTEMRIPIALLIEFSNNKCEN